MKYGMVVDLKRCLGCHACTVTCKQKNGTPPKTFWAQVHTSETGTYPNARREFMPTLCMHCSAAPCVNACPTGATYRRDDGIVLIDQDKCIGCRYCMAACPYRARSYNLGESNSYFADQEPTPYEEEKTLHWQAGTVSKCILCADKIDAGEEPACAQACPTQARIFGDLEGDVLPALIDARNGYQELAETGTDPSVYYLPR